MNGKNAWVPILFQRYAIYYVPPDGGLADFGAAWFGWDIRNGSSGLRRQIAGLPMPVEELTAVPRKYGMHGTLKAPFRLAADTDEAALCADLEALTSALPQVIAGGLELTRMSGFAALRPSGGTAALSSLAAMLVEHLDRHREPATQEELTRRRKAGLSAEEEKLLARWGYPHVMDRFRFHITLTGPVSASEGPAVMAALSPVLRPICSPDFAVDQVALVGEAESSMFHLIRRFQLGG